MNAKLTRRGFTAAVGASALHATSRGYWANETIRVGCIGTGGRCRHLLEALQRVPNVNVTALCDVWDEALAKAKKYAIDGALQTKRYEDLLERDDIDAVLIATPDHWHVPLTIAACEAGKDVYVEKPLTHVLEEGQLMLQAHQRHKRVVQVGTQQRSMPHIREAAELVSGSKLGAVFRADLTWNRNIERGIAKHEIDPMTVDWKRFLGNAPDQPFDAYRFREWRWMWDFGGGLFTDLMVHFLDCVNWMTGAATPTKTASIGTHIHAKGAWETPDTVQTLMEYPETSTGPSLQVHFQGTFSNKNRRAMMVLMGTDGSLYVDRGRYKYIPEGEGKEIEKVLSTKPEFLGADFYDKPDGEYLHLENWLNCIRTRETPFAPVEAGVAAASAAHAANLALRGNGVWHATS